LAKLKLQPLKVQSVNVLPDKSLSEKSQLLNMQFSYSPFASV
jgi:hypothetical protein